MSFFTCLWIVLQRDDWGFFVRLFVGVVGGSWGRCWWMLMWWLLISIFGKFWKNYFFMRQFCLFVIFLNEKY